MKIQILDRAKKKKFIEGATTIIDGVKFGYVNVIVGFNILNPQKSSKKEIIL